LFPRPITSRSTRRRAAALAVSGACALSLLVGCGSADSEVASGAAPAAGTGAFPRTISHFRGDTAIEAAPQRIVALDNSYADAVILLESELVGYTDYRQPGLPEYLGEDRETYGAEAVSLGPLANPSLERLAALRPDLIVSANVRHEAIYPQLSEIAPTVFSETTGPTWKDNIRLVAQALGKEDLAEQKISEYEERARAIGADINATAGNPAISIVRFAGEPTARLYRTTSFSGIVLQDAGLARPESQGVDPANPTSIMNPISPEQIGLADADVIFVTTYDDPANAEAGRESAEPFVTNPLWGRLHGRKVEVADSIWMTPVSIQGAHKILDDLADAFGVDRHR
jgi:iron complex transport system substrate-binding protein